MGEAIAVMRDGGIVQIGTPDELYEQPIHTCRHRRSARRT